jgi:8-hydroxy-5-deazaflavin:NADPH oxidoreductase
MQIGMLGTGSVGQTLGSKLLDLGHAVMLGSRAAGGETALAWAAGGGPHASQGTFAQAAAFGELIFNATNGAASLEALASVAPESLAGKILVDVSNPLDYSSGARLSLTVCNTDSLGEQIQRAHPRARVVKALNTVTARVMVEPSLLPGPHDIFISGDDPDAKLVVTGLLRDGFGWQRVVDLGGIATSRSLEMYLPLWVDLMDALGTTLFNVQLVVAEAQS